MIEREVRLNCAEPSVAKMTRLKTVISYLHTTVDVNKMLQIILQNHK